jgi:CRP-like cAMP-binding protein
VARKTRKARFDPREFLSTVDGGRTVADYRKNEIIFSQGDPADAVFYVQTGKVKIVVTSEQRGDAVVAVLGAGEFFGEGQLTRLSTGHCQCLRAACKWSGRSRRTEGSSLSGRSPMAHP